MSSQPRAVTFALATLSAMVLLAFAPTATVDAGCGDYLHLAGRSARFRQNGAPAVAFAALRGLASDSSPEPPRCQGLNCSSGDLPPPVSLRIVVSPGREMLLMAALTFAPPSVGLRHESELLAVSLRAIADVFRPPR